MAHHPLLQIVRALLAVVQQNWPHDAMMVVLKSGLAPLSAGDADELENYVLRHRIRGSGWSASEPWSYRRSVTAAFDEEGLASPEQVECDRMDALRRAVVEPVRPFARRFREAGAAVPLREIVTELFALLERLGVRGTMAKWIEAARSAGDAEQASEHEQVWAELVALFEQMVDLMGPEPLTLAAFTDVLESGLEGFDLALAPPTVDQVLVGQVDRTRTPPVRAALLLGLGEGMFPYAPRDATVLSDAERGEMRKRDFEVEADTQRRLLDENLLGYIAFTRAGESLYASRPVSDKAGRALGPSPFWARLRELLPAGKAIVVLPRDERGRLDLIATPRQLLTSLMCWARGDEPLASTEAWPSLYQWVARHACCDDPIDRLRYRVWRALGYDNHGDLSPEVARQLFASPLVVTATQLECFAACPFQHFVRHALALEEPADEDPTGLDLSTLYHQTLEKLVREMLRRRLDWATLPPDEAERLIQQCTWEIGQALRQELMISTARNRHLLRQVERTLQMVVASQRAMAERGEARTAHVQVPFGRPGSKLPPLVVLTPAGHELRLHGKIDRVDLLEKRDAFAIVDYRMGGPRVEMHRVAHGLSLQLMAYLLVMREHGEKLTGRKMHAAAAFYTRLLRGLESVAHPSKAMDPADPTFHLRAKPRGVVNAEFVDAFDSEMDVGKSDVIAAQRKADGTLSTHNTDTATPRQLDRLLEYVRRRMGEIADEILAGHVGITPYRIGTQSACPTCSYKCVCRFDPAINRYRDLRRVGREEILDGDGAAPEADDVADEENGGSDE